MAENTTPGSAQYVNTGAASTIGGKSTELRKYDRSDRFIMQEAAWFPFTTVLISGPDSLAKRMVTDSTFHTNIDDDYTLTFTPSAASGSLQTTEGTLYFSAADSRQINVGDILTVNGMFSNGSANVTTYAAGYHPERVRVLSKGTESASTPIEVQREIASATEITTSMSVTKSGAAMEDGYTVGTGYDVEQSWIYNYVQLFSRPFAVDKVREATDSFGPADIARQMNLNKRAFMREINVAYHDGVRSLINAPITNKERRTMGGMAEIIPSGNQTTGVGTLTFEKLNNYSINHFAQGSQRKWVFSGPAALTYLSNKSDNRLVYNDKISKMTGIPQVKEFESSNGTYVFVKDGSLQGRGDHFSQQMRIYDMMYLRQVWLNKHEIKLESDIQTKREKIRQFEYCGGLSLERAFVNAHHALFGITG